MQMRSDRIVGDSTKPSGGPSRGRKVRTLPRKRAERAASAKLTSIQNLLARENEKLLDHQYFQLCRAQAIGRHHLLAIVKQMYGFSLLFERLLTRRIAESSSHTDGRVLRIARRLLREEFGHPELFYDSLRANGLSKDELTQATPNTFLRALYGYLLATIQHENEYVANVAITYVMETIGLDVFGATFPLLEQNGMISTFLKQHAEEDAAHSQMGIELVSSFTDQTMSASKRVISDIFRIMHLVLDDFVALGREREARA
jgi:pyrroloquinoline quinone (PQQ) biosynthesis protein C